MPKCPKCVDGIIGVPAHIRFADGKKPTETELSKTLAALMKCSHCNGTGTITEQQLQWIQIGEEMRKTRLLKGVGLRECAERLGILPSVYSEMESGRREPDPSVLDRLATTRLHRLEPR